jgi:hypothetical protein
LVAGLRVCNGRPKKGGQKQEKVSLICGVFHYKSRCKLILTTYPTLNNKKAGYMKPAPL